MIEIEFENKLHEGQEAIWKEFVKGDKYKRCVANIARQWGKTTLCKRAALYWGLNFDGCEIGWLAPETKHFSKVIEWFGYLKEETNGEMIKRVDKMSNVVQFFNGSVIRFYSVENHKAIRGQTFDFRIMDEFAFGRFGQLEAIASYQATFAVNGKKDFIVSTPKGKNQMYDVFQTALYREDELAVTAKSEENPFVSRQFLLEMKKQFPDTLYRQEFEAEFIDGTGEVFGDITSNCTVERYLSESNEPCYLGGDIALGGEDSTTVVVLNSSGSVLTREYWRESNTAVQIAKIKAIARNFNIQGGYIEINTERGIQQSVALEFPQIKEWMTTRKTKPGMIQNLKKDIEEGNIQLPTPELDPVMYNELTMFGAETMGDGYIKYSHPPGGHDDSVIALALANEARVPNRYNNRTNSVRRFKRHKRYNPYMR